MIIATRIPQLAAQLRAATIRAAAQQRTALPAAPVADRELAVRDAVHRLERLGFRVTLERAAA